MFVKYKIYAAIAVIILSVGSTYVVMWRHNIRQQALFEFNQKQLEQTIKDQQKYVADLKSVTEIQKNTIEEVTKKNDQLKNQLNDLEAYLSSDQANKDSKQASDILKRTFKDLGAN